MGTRKLMAVRIPITQYLRPDGRRTERWTEVDDETGALARDMICSAEVLSNGMVVLYVRHKDDDEDDELVEFARNIEGPNSPQDVIIKLVREAHARHESRKV